MIINSDVLMIIDSDVVLTMNNGSKLTKMREKNSRRAKNKMFHNSRKLKTPAKNYFPVKNISRQIYFSSKNKNLIFFLNFQNLNQISKIVKFAIFQDIVFMSFIAFFIIYTAFYKFKCIFPRVKFVAILIGREKDLNNDLHIF